MLLADILQAIDQRVRSGEQNIVAFGIVNSAIDLNNVMVTFDGSTASIPCKSVGNAQVLEGDRVVLVKVAPWWVVLGSFPGQWASLPNGHAQVVQTTPGTTTSATFADLPTTVEDTFRKMFDPTRVLITVHGSCYVSAVPSAMEFGVSLTSPLTGTNSYSVAPWSSNVVNDHRPISGVQVLNPALLSPSLLVKDNYTVRVQWRRASGTGTYNVDSGDSVGFTIQEI
jgi:hypothetical protein